jgi:hypothetical protein
VSFTPLPGEGGDYEVAADRPSVVGNVTQVQFSIIAMSVTPGQMAHRLLVGVSQTGHVDLRNLGTRPLTGIQAAVVGAAANVSIQVSAPSELAPSASAPVTYTVTALNDSILANPGAQIRFLSAEGAAVILPLNIEVVSLAPRLSATPAALNAAMLRGGQKIVECEISNTGGTPTGELTVALPSAPWLALVTPALVPSLAPGERATVDLALTPAADLPLGPYTGTIVTSSAATNLTIPFQFTAVSDLIGDVHVTVVDEFTFFAEGAPKVSGATVTLTDPATNGIVRTGTTAANGELSFTGVREGYYYIESRAAEHTSHRATLLVTASQVTEVSVFLARELISYTWIVTPTEIEDHYIFVLDVTFVTNVPAPVVTVEPASIDLSTLTDEVTQMNFTITNHGLIAAEHVNLSFQNDPVWQITPLVGYVGTLAAQQSVVIPVTITRQGPARPPRFAALSLSPSPPPNGQCQIGGIVGYDFQCGGSTQLRSTPIIAYNGNGDCGPLPTEPPVPPTPGVIGPPISTTQAPNCAIEILRDEAGGEVRYEKIEGRLGKALPGQQINLRLKVPQGVQPTEIEWIIPGLEEHGTCFKDYAANNQSARRIPLSVDDTTRQDVHFYWADSGAKTITANYTLNGEAKSISATIDVRRPSSSLSTTIGAVRKVGPNIFGLFGDDVIPYGITFLGQVSLPIEFNEQGTWQFVQLVNDGAHQTLLDGRQQHTIHTGEWVLDTVYPYDPPSVTGSSNIAVDSPYFEVVPGLSRMGTQDRFRMFLTYRPPGEESRYVPLLRVDWGWQCEAVLSFGVWRIVDGSTGQHVSAADVEVSQPEWSANCEPPIWVTLP